MYWKMWKQGVEKHVVTCEKKNIYIYARTWIQYLWKHMQEIGIGIAFVEGDCVSREEGVDLGSDSMHSLLYILNFIMCALTTQNNF